MTNETERPATCAYVSCDSEPRYELAYTETGHPYSYKWLCAEHKNTEQIHDPIGTKIVTEPWEIAGES